MVNKRVHFELLNILISFHKITLRLSRAKLQYKSIETVHRHSYYTNLVEIIKLEKIQVEGHSGQWPNGRDCGMAAGCKLVLGLAC